MSGALLLAAVLAPTAVLVVASAHPDRGWPWLLTRGAGWALLAGGLIGVVLALCGAPPP